MDNIVLNITIGERSKSEAFLSFYKEQGIELSLGTYGQGTASKETLDALGLGSKDKCVIFSFMTMDKSKRVLVELETRMQLRRIGVGLSFSIPISSIDSLSSLKRIIHNFNVEKEGEGYSLDTENELIVVIANRGYTETVMEVAKKAGAGGGTVVHARGTGSEKAEKFFGTVIGAEKEMIFIVCKTIKSKDIMKAIKEEAGPDTDSEAMSFSLPVCDASGLLES